MNFDISEIKKYVKAPAKKKKRTIPKNKKSDPDVKREARRSNYSMLINLNNPNLPLPRQLELIKKLKNFAGDIPDLMNPQLREYLIKMKTDENNPDYIEPDRLIIKSSASAIEVNRNGKIHIHLTATFANAGRAHINNKLFQALIRYYFRDDPEVKPFVDIRWYQDTAKIHELYAQKSTHPLDKSDVKV
jgi:hypothetical protein